MAEIFMYADETGNLDYDGEGKSGATAYFGFGTAVFEGDHGAALFDGIRLRATMEERGIQLVEGFHAVNDSTATRNRVFQVIADQRPRFDTTFLAKSRAYPSVRARGQMYLYELAWYLHVKQIALQVSQPGDTLYVIAGAFGTRSRQGLARTALANVCTQVDRKIVLCVWRSGTSWGLQVADYGLWAVQRVLEGRRCTWFEPCVEPTLRSCFTPWGKA